MDRIFVVEKLRIPIFSVIMSDLLSQDTSFQNVLTNIPITPLDFFKEKKCKFSIAQGTRLAHVYLNIAKLLVNSTVSIPLKK